MAETNIISTDAPRKPVVIYGLVDPRTDAVRYVGKSDDVVGRFRGHMCEAGANDTAKSVWIRELLSVGLKPIVRHLEIVSPGGDWGAAEKRQIAALKAAGAVLFNKTSGGQGVPDCARDDHWRAAIAASHVDNPKRVHGQKRAGEKLRGRKQSPESIEKRASQLRGRKLSPEQCAMIGARTKGRKLPPEQVEAMRVRQTGVKQSPESSTKKRAAMLAISESQSTRLRENWQKPEFRARMTETRKGIPKPKEFVEKMAAGIKRTWQDPDVRARRIAGLRKNSKSPEYRQKQREIIRAKWRDPEFRRMMCEARRR